MEFEELCFYSNETMLKNFAQKFSISYLDLQNKIKLVAHHTQLMNMAVNLNKALQQNPNASVNFGEYGAKIASELNIEQEAMYQALIACSCHELLMSVTTQLHTFYQKK